jgi:hypothetical protein
MRTLTLITLALASLVGCVPLHAVRAVALSPQGNVRVALKKRDRELFKLTVTNDSALPLVVDRDAIVLATPEAVEPRKRGGYATVYSLQPGSAHEVNVRFDLKAVRHGEPVEINFDHALFAAGQPVSVPPLVFVAD